MTQPPAWLDELPLRAGPPWHPMGTRPVDAAEWLAATGDDDDARAAQLAAKRAILRDDATHDEAVVRSELTGVHEAEVAAGALLAPGPSIAAFEAAVATVPDDVCVLLRRDGHWRLASAVVCFPSVWRPVEKIGRPVSEIHGPVPGYADELADRVDRVLDGLRPDRPLWRRNWFLHRSPVLHQPVAAPDAAPAVVPDGFWLRSERQTLRRLERPDAAAVFTIRTQIAPLAVLRHRPDVATSMAAALRSWPAGLVEYRRAGRWRDDVAGWLDAAG